jgi:hypothetical protein
VTRLLPCLIVSLFTASCDAQGLAGGYQTTESELIGRSRATGGDIHWIDNEQVLLIAAKADDYVVPVPNVKERRFRLYIWRPKDNNVIEYHNADIANGSLCLHERYMRLTYTSTYRMNPEHKRWYVLQGPLGQETLELQTASAREDRRNYVKVLNRYTCREYDPRSLPNLGYRTRPLLEGE